MNPGILAAIGAGTKHAHASSFKLVYLTTIAFGGAGLIAALFTQDISKYMTSFVNKTVAGKPMRANDLAKTEEVA
jgi:uncharacterized membrane protein